MKYDCYREQAHRWSIVVDVNLGRLVEPEIRGRAHCKSLNGMFEIVPHSISMHYDEPLLQFLPFTWTSHDSQQPEIKHIIILLSEREPNQSKEI